MKDKIVAFGEIMLRLTPPDYTTISEAKNFMDIPMRLENIYSSFSRLCRYSKARNCEQY